VVVRAGDVLPRGLTRVELLLGARPHLPNEVRTEITKCRVNDCSVDVAEYAPTAQEVEAKSIESELFAASDGLRVKDESLGQSTRL
jgi:hypothetical protein